MAPEMMKKRPGIIFIVSLLFLVSLGLPAGYSTLLFPGGIDHEARASAGADPDDAYWDDSFVFHGMNKAARAVTCAAGRVFVGGEFTLAGGRQVNMLAAWDGASWSALGFGELYNDDFSTPKVYAVAAAGDTLYVGGKFDQVGGRHMGGIAMWDGSQWKALGQGLSRDNGAATVAAIALYKGDLYVAGDFTKAGSVPANHVAKWDGTSWSSVPGNVGASAYSSGRMNALLVKDDKLYIGGGSSVISWDGQAWVTVGRADGNIRALACDSSGIYAAGDFSAIGSVAASDVARWDGVRWHSLGSRSDVTGAIYALACWHGELYAGGDFLTADGLSANHIRKWDGYQWSRVGEGIAHGTDGDVYGMAVDGDELIVVGDFLRAGDKNARGVALWNGSDWRHLDEGEPNTVDAPVRAVVAFDSTVFVGGDFRIAGGKAARRMAGWDGKGWFNLGGGVGSKVGFIGEMIGAMTSVGKNLLVGGRFFSAGGASAASLALWNGSEWHEFGGGVWNNRKYGDAGYVYALAERDGAVYVGGTFVNLGAIRASGIGRWIDGRWENLGQGVGHPQEPAVMAIAFCGDEVVIGGRFTVVDMQNAWNIAEWDSGGWHALGEGVMGTVYAIAVVGDTIYAGGEFLEAGGIPASNVARWYDGAWHPLEEGLNGPVKSLVTIRGEVYAGGEFTASGTLALNHIAKWNGRWVPLGSGVNGEVRTMAARGDELFVGGDFSRAGAKVCNFFARWYKPFPVYLAIDTLQAEIAGEGVRITWEAVVKKEIRGIQIYRIGSDGGEVPLCGDGLLDPSAVEYVDRSAVPGRSYTYIIALVRLDGTEVRSDPVSVTLPAPPTALLANYPNPFKGSTTIPFTLGADGHVVLKIFDIRGRLVATLADDDFPAGYRERIWDGRNERGRVMPSGVYVYFLDTGYARLSGKMVLVR